MHSRPAKPMIKNTLRTLCKPILQRFETGDDPYVYKPMSRKILIVMGLLFGGMAAIAIIYILRNDAYGYFLPGLVFSLVSLVCLMVGFLGNERAVAKIWGNK